jgi:hypothetical protein
MTIIQTNEVSTTLVANSEGLANAVAVATLTSAASTATSTTFFDSDITQNASATAWHEYEIKSQIGSSYGITNLSACQTLTGSVVAPVGNGGLGRIRVTDGAVSKILKCDTTKRGGQTYRDFAEYTTGTVSRYLYDQVEPIFD